MGWGGGVDWCPCSGLTERSDPENDAYAGLQQK